MDRLPHGVEVSVDTMIAPRSSSGTAFFGQLGRGRSLLLGDEVELPDPSVMWPTQQHRHAMRHARAATDTHPMMLRQHDLQPLRLRHERQQRQEASDVVLMHASRSN